jgi:mannitol operon transcriptional antiterminator
MYLSAREKFILQEFVIADQHTISVEHLMNILSITDRSVYRELDSLDLQLNSVNAEIRKVENGVYLLQANVEALANIKEAIESDEERGLSVRERQTAILLDLISASRELPVGYFCNEYLISPMTFLNDLHVLEGKLVHLPFRFVNHDGNYTVDIGEKFRRLLIVHLLCEELEDQQLLRVSQKENHFWRYIPREFVNAATSIMREEMKKGKYQDLTHKKIKYLTILHAIEIHRYEEGHIIDPESTRKGFSEDSLAEARYLFKIFAEWTDSTYSDAEVFIWAEKYEAFVSKYEYSFYGIQYHGGFTFQVKQLIEYVSGVMGVDFMADEQLFQLLLMHLHAMFDKVAIEQMQLDNPMLKEVVIEYNNVAEAVRVAQLMYFPEVTFSDEEIAYVVIHFVNSIVMNQENVGA